jgi:hypothetical protein
VWWIDCYRLVKCARNMEIVILIFSVIAVAMGQGEFEILTFFLRNRPIVGVFGEIQDKLIKTFS